jgi:hypothetical protein
MSGASGRVVKRVRRRLHWACSLAIIATVGSVLVAPSPANASVTQCAVVFDGAHTFYQVQCRGSLLGWYQPWVECGGERYNGPVGWVPFFGGWGEPVKVWCNYPAPAGRSTWTRAGYRTGG